MVKYSMLAQKNVLKKLLSLPKIVIKNTYNKSKLEWYGNPDHRSYRVSLKS